MYTYIIQNHAIIWISFIHYLLSNVATLHWNYNLHYIGHIKKLEMSLAIALEVLESLIISKGSLSMVD